MNTMTMDPPAVADEPLFAVLGELQAVVEHGAYLRHDLAPALDDYLTARTDALHTRVLTTRARTLTGLIWKLSELAECLETDDQALPWAAGLARSALQDAVEMKAG